MLLPVLAQVWRVGGDNLTPDQYRAELARVMLDPIRAEAIWDVLDDQARGALQMLIATGNKMPESQFQRVFGEIRRMGSEAIKREKPHQQPRTPADALYYRGFISVMYENADTGTRTVIYIPDDLLTVLPVHKTGYENLENADDDGGYDEAEDETSQIEPMDQDTVRGIRAADTSFVDDMTTLLAFLRIYSPLLDTSYLSAEDIRRLLPHLLVQDETRLHFLMALALTAELVDVQAGRAYPKKAETQRWLNAPRPDQVRLLAEKWRDTDGVIDLLFVPGLFPEMNAGVMAQYSPAAARAGVFEMMGSLLPPNGWWAQDAFIGAIYEENPDFQRPNGDFNTWYIRNEQGDYLNGFENWDAVEGAFLDYLINSPLHWLGLIDLAENAARFTAYGRAFLRLQKWVSPPETLEKIEIAGDGSIHVSRKVSRLDRYQIARFASWVSAGNPYVYRIDAPAIQQAAAQNITVGHISEYLTRMIGGGALPAPIARILDRWKHGAAASVSVERLLVLRTTAPEVLEQLYEQPATRRFFGARLGPMAAVIRADQWDGLRAALGELGVQVEVIGL